MYPQNYNNYNGGQDALDMRVSHVMRNVYLKMFLALLVTTAASFAVGAIPGSHTSSPPTPGYTGACSSLSW